MKDKIHQSLEQRNTSGKIFKSHGMQRARHLSPEMGCLINMLSEINEIYTHPIIPQALGRDSNECDRSEALYEHVEGVLGKTPCQDCWF